MYLYVKQCLRLYASAPGAMQLRLMQHFTEISKAYRSKRHTSVFVCSTPAQQGYFEGANPVKLAEIPAFAPNGAETMPY